MSTYEKVTTIILGVLLAAMLVFSYHEITEPKSPAMFNGSPTFDTTIGKDFTIDGYSNIVSSNSSGGLEQNCQALQPVVIAVLHDIQERLQKLSGADTVDDIEVNLSTLQLLCQKNVRIILANADGDQLVLDKAPFARTIPPDGTAADIGTEIRINATIVKKGSPAPTAPTTYGDILILDRFLNAATTSPL